ncbi:MAG: tetratricopeptide repeat protein [Sandaracinaceae bacterium]|nr:tetratricopeptide repeat protein [Sandaracinaceae bacterium]
MSDRPMHTVPGLFAKLQALYAQGEQAIAEERFADAIALFSEGIALDDHFRQRYVTMYAQRAFAAHRAGDCEAALRDYARAIEMEPPINQAQYHFQSGMCLAQLGRFDEAALAYGRSIAIEDGQPGPWHLRGKLLTLELGRHEEAIADFDRFLAMRAHPEVSQLRGYAQIQLGKGREAIGDLVESRRMRPDPYTSYLLACAGALAGDDDLVYEAMAATLEADPGYRAYFVEGEDFARYQSQDRFRAIAGVA